MGPRLGIPAQNNSSSAPICYQQKKLPDILTKDVEEQRDKGRLTRVDILPSKFISSPLGLVPKSNGTWRRIHHLSHPEGSSVNEFIPQEWGALEYPTFDDAVAKIRKQGKMCILVKRNFSDAFRHIPVAKSDWWLLGFQWDKVYWMERFLPFGLRTSPFLFDLFAKGINWMCLQNQHDVLHYLHYHICITLPNGYGCIIM